MPYFFSLQSLSDHLLPLSFSVCICNSVSLSEKQKSGAKAFSICKKISNKRKSYCSCEPKILEVKKRKSMMMMEGIKEGGGGGRVGVGEEDMGDGMQCSDHPYRNNPGGICAFCLQEKLGKLVSSSFPLPIRSSTSSSSSPSFRSDIAGAGNGIGIGIGNGNGVVSSSSSLSLSLSVRPTSTKSKNIIDNGSYTRRARIPFLLTKKKKKIMVVASSSDRAVTDTNVFKRSKSTTAPRRGHFLDADAAVADEYSPRRRGGFWSFLYLSSKKIDRESKITTLTTVKPKDKCLGSTVEEDDSPHNQSTAASASASSFGRKVSRSRSVGCGSRSFSGDFFERISTGFGDCTLRRVESQREGKPKVSNNNGTEHQHHHHQCMKERVKCGGIFGGFIMTSSSSSASSSSSYWVSASAEDHVNGKSAAAAAAAGGGQLVHGRSKSWGWAFASPMRAFGKPSTSNISKDGIKRSDIIRNGSNKNSKPNLDAIPSLLAVRG